MTDFDACCSTCGHSCFNSSTCIDLSPDEVDTLGRGFNCTGCKVGYSIQNDICTGRYSDVDLDCMGWAVSSVG